MNEFSSFSSDSNDWGSLSASMNDAPTLTSSVTSVGNIVFGITAVVAILAIIVTIVILVKSIIDRKKLNAELTLETIKGVKVTSIILIVVNAISIITNCLAVLMLIMPIISVVFTSNAQKEIENNPELAKSKANTASILNIISAVLPIVGFVVAFVSTAILSAAVIGGMM